MRICLFQTSDNPSRGDDGYPDPGLYTDQHTFEHRLISKDSIKQDIDLAAAEGFDVYMLISWEWHDDQIQSAGIQIAKYLEELRLPFIGLPSRILERCKPDLAGRSQLRLAALDSGNPSSDDNRHLVAAGDEYACVVVQLGNTPVALSPGIRHQKEILKRTSNPRLYDEIRSLAEGAFHATDMHGCSWCTVLFRVTNNSKPMLIGIDPMSRIFLPQLSVEDCAIRESFPGGHRLLINSVIASSLSVHSRSAELLRKVGDEYDGVAPKYDAVTHGIYHDNVKKIATKYNYDGVVLDLACGTGLFARLKGEAQGVTSGDHRIYTTRFIGVDLSPQMRAECLLHGWYERVLVGPIQHVLTEWVDPVDHIVCIGALHYLDRNEVSLVLSRAFQLARGSVTYTIDEIPESYIAAQRSRGREYMHGVNHVDEVAAYGVPVGWKLADHWKCLGWKSPTTGDDVYTNIFRFERLDEASL
ncbi:class I SAM-dependent methyltransferase [Aspergillus fischeri NRRL 181]|uniref:Methyltransferase domain-containing protein n=1 Tax=Neosartorya fischeri (strain ATCC 1020 / DSM 3700 / CBS 544.65 / FGSC A1164 / JCM 1740 / NRRL 181 / WB 181) TaxID=331117 RepID=A1D2C2_NEOFI|nr:uncharacterized protein NFIA_012540 [Aspergillus fischeri NRRL 181]EAW22565.1 hypothetical protein NFIA_012540 [Aspergillus fischeri NRRL 181]KAG2000797.1 hypothetical protein GB937_010823 [Aspergillus fischeri]